MQSNDPLWQTPKMVEAEEPSVLASTVALESRQPSKKKKSFMDSDIGFF